MASTKSTKSYAEVKEAYLAKIDKLGEKKFALKKKSFNTESELKQEELKLQ